MAVEKKKEEKKSMIIVVPSCLKDADGARTRSDQLPKIVATYVAPLVAHTSLGPIVATFVYAFIRIFSVYDSHKTIAPQTVVNCSSLIERKVVAGTDLIYSVVDRRGWIVDKSYKIVDKIYKMKGSMFEALYWVVRTVFLGLISLARMLKIYQLGKPSEEGAETALDVKNIPESVNFHFTRQCNYQCGFYAAINCYIQ